MHRQFQKKLKASIWTSMGQGGGIPVRAYEKVAPVMSVIEV